MRTILNMALEGYFDDDDEDYFNSESSKSYRENTPRETIIASDFNSYDLRRYMCKLFEKSYAIENKELFSAFKDKIKNSDFKREMCDFFECSYAITNEKLIDVFLFISSNNVRILIGSDLK
jgi:hypothetical protein